MKLENECLTLKQAYYTFANLPHHPKYQCENLMNIGNYSVIRVCITYEYKDRYFIIHFPFLEGRSNPLPHNRFMLDFDLCEHDGLKIFINIHFAPYPNISDRSIFN